LKGSPWRKLAGTDLSARVVVYFNNRLLSPKIASMEIKWFHPVFGISYIDGIAVAYFVKTM